jgi:hypothetical protein
MPTACPSVFEVRERGPVGLEDLHSTPTNVVEVEPAAFVREELPRADPQEQLQMLEISCVGEELIESALDEVQVELLDEVGQTLVPNVVGQCADRMAVRDPEELCFHLLAQLVAHPTRSPLGTESLVA